MKRYKHPFRKLPSDCTLPNAPHYAPLCNQSGSGGALVPPVRGKGADGLVVARETVDTGLDENEAATQISVSGSLSSEDTSVYAQLGVPVLAVARQVLADGNSLLDQHVEVLGDLRSEACKGGALSANATNRGKFV